MAAGSRAPGYCSREVRRMLPKRAAVQPFYANGRKVRYLLCTREGSIATTLPLPFLCLHFGLAFLKTHYLGVSRATAASTEQQSACMPALSERTSSGAHGKRSVNQTLQGQPSIQGVHPHRRGFDRLSCDPPPPPVDTAQGRGGACAKRLRPSRLPVRRGIARPRAPRPAGPPRYRRRLHGGGVILQAQAGSAPVLRLRADRGRTGALQAHPVQGTERQVRSTFTAHANFEKALVLSRGSFLFFVFGVSYPPRLYRF